MKTHTALFAALAAAPSVLAHTVFTNLYVDGVDQGDAVAMRMKMEPQTAGSPLVDYSSNSMACNVGGEKGVARVVSVKDGSTLSFEFRSWPDDKSKISLDPGHKGPCAVYLKKVDSAIEDQGHGDGWFKIWDDGFSDGQWCTDKMIANGGRISVKLPTGLQGGYYLARPELVALHDTGKPQFYTGCAQTFIESSGDLGPASTVSIPGYVKDSEEAMKWNIYYGMDNSKYPVLGPAVANLVSAQSGSIKAQLTQTEGQKPEDCVLQNGNFCFKEVPDYKTEAECWKSSENCWNQNKECWASTAPTGGSGCKVWEKKCEEIADTCRAGKSGPPNKGMDLTPKPTTIDVGIVEPTKGVAAEVPDAPKSSEPAKTSTSAPAYDAPEATSSQKAPSSALPSSVSFVEASSIDALNPSNPVPTPDPAKPKPTTTTPAKLSSIAFVQKPVVTGSAPSDSDCDSFITVTYTPTITITPSSSGLIPFATTPAPPCESGVFTQTVTETTYITVTAKAGGYRRGEQNVAGRRQVRR